MESEMNLGQNLTTVVPAPVPESKFFLFNQWNYDSYYDRIIHFGHDYFGGRLYLRCYAESSKVKSRKVQRWVLVGQTKNNDNND